MARIRYHVTPRDAPPAIAARALGLTLEQFSEHLPMLIGRGFPPIDKTTGMYDLKAIDRWQDARYPQIFGTEKSTTAVDARLVMRDRLRAQA